jgi:hypothetical protein
VTFSPDRTRSAPGAGRLSILAPPGTYTVQVSVGGKQFTQKLEVRKDPNSGGSDADIQQQMKVLTEIAADIDQAADMINRLELVRSQIAYLSRIIPDQVIRKGGDELDRKLVDLETNLIEVRMTGQGQDGVRWGAKLQGKLVYLANGLMSGDFGPTAQQLEVQKVLQGRLRSLGSDLETLFTRDVGAFNEQLRARNLPTIVTQVGRSGS